MMVERECQSMMMGVIAKDDFNQVKIKWGTGSHFKCLIAGGLKIL